jgi:hypothetical protein
METEVCFAGLACLQTCLCIAVCPLLQAGISAKLPEAAMALKALFECDADVAIFTHPYVCTRLVPPLAGSQLGNPARLPEAALALNALYNADVAIFTHPFLHTSCPSPCWFTAGQPSQAARSRAGAQGAV